MNSGLRVRTSLRIVTLLLALQAVSVYLLWSLNPSMQSDQTTFAAFLAVVLVCLSMISYTLRVEKRGDSANRFLLLAGCFLILLLLFTAVVA